MSDALRQPTYGVQWPGYGTDSSIDPDQVTVPESLDHREFTDTLALLASVALGPDRRVCRNLAWYPTPVENSMAPDLMVLPSSVVPDGTTSYRQTVVAGPAPSVVVEVVSHGNDLANGLAKFRRYRKLGVPAMIIDLDEGVAERLEPDGTMANAVGRPIPELGGVLIVLDPVRGLLVEGVDGLRARRLDDVPAALSARAEAQSARAEAESARAEAESARAEAESARAEAESARVRQLEDALRALGHEPPIR